MERARGGATLNAGQVTGDTPEPRGGGESGAHCSREGGRHTVDESEAAGLVPLTTA